MAIKKHWIVPNLSSAGWPHSPSSAVSLVILMSPLLIVLSVTMSAVAGRSRLGVGGTSGCMKRAGCGRGKSKV